MKKTNHDKTISPPHPLVNSHLPFLHHPDFKSKLAAKSNPKSRLVGNVFSSV
jgi:hypothetical protein